MMRAVFVWFCTIQSVVNNFVMSLILLWSYIYLFAFCVIQSSLCEMALLLFKINQMLRSKFVYFPFFVFVLFFVFY